MDLTKDKFHQQKAQNLTEHFFIVLMVVFLKVFFNDHRSGEIFFDLLNPFVMVGDQLH